MPVTRRSSRLRGAASRLLFLVLLAALVPLAGRPARAQAPVLPGEPAAYDLYSHGPYRRSVPRPSALLGYEIEQAHSTFRDQERVLLAIAAAAPDRVRIVEYGKSVEGRPLRLVLVSAPENLKRLEAIRSDIGKLADPRTLSGSAEADRITANTPTLTWIGLRRMLLSQLPPPKGGTACPPLEASAAR
jgi:hypothetical protein